MARVICAIVGILGLGALAAYLLVRTPDVPPTALTVYELVSQGSEYNGRIVAVKGTVVGAAGILSLGGYRLRDLDGTEEVLVVTDAGVPSFGSSEIARGIFTQGVEFNQFRYGVILPERWCKGEGIPPMLAQVFPYLCKPK